MVGDRVVRVRLRRIAPPERPSSRIDRRREREAIIWERILGWIIVGTAGGLIMAAANWMMRVWLELGVWAVTVTGGPR